MVGLACNLLARRTGLPRVTLLQAEVLGLVCVTAGPCEWLGVSFPLAGLVAGAVIANLITHHDRAFHETEHVQWPFMLLFFLMARAVLEVTRAGVTGSDPDRADPAA